MSSELRLHRNADGVCGACDAKLRQEAGAMHFDGFFADAQRRGDLLVAPAAHHLVQDLTLAHRELADELLGPLSSQRRRRLCPSTTSIWEPRK